MIPPARVSRLGMYSKTSSWTDGCKVEKGYWMTASGNRSMLQSVSKRK